LTGTATAFGGAEFDIGQQISSPAWLQVTQELMDGFGKYTIDPDPFHIDPVWAKEHSPFGGTIAFGFFTVSMLTHLLHLAQGTGARDVAADPVTHGHCLNYGFNRLRLVSPVHIGKNIRGVFKVKELAGDEKGRAILTFAVTIEIEGEERPALVADWLAVWISGDAG
jgi:acyl dehydratase